MWKLFQTKGSSKYNWTQHFNQIYEKVRALLLLWYQCLVMAVSLPIILTLFVTVVLICSNISWLANVISPSHGKLCKVRVYWYNCALQDDHILVGFYPTYNVLLSGCLNFNLFYQYNLHYTQDSKIHKLHVILKPTVIYDASKLLENSYVMEWISSLH